MEVDFSVRDFDCKRESGAKAETVAKSLILCKF